MNTATHIQEKTGLRFTTNVCGHGATEKVVPCTLNEIILFGKKRKRVDGKCAKILLKKSLKVCILKLAKYFPFMGEDFQHFTIILFVLHTHF